MLLPSTESVLIEMSITRIKKKFYIYVIYVQFLTYGCEKKFP